MSTKIGMIIYDKVQPMDFMGPWEVFSLWKNALNAPIELYLISEKGGEVHCDSDITVQAHCNFQDAPQMDYLVVPGGRGRLDEVNNEKLLAFIRQQAKHSKYLLSVCTGMFLVHAAHILQTADVTTYWRALPEVKALNDVKAVGQRIVKNGNVWFSGGISSGIDLAFELIAEAAGKETAGKVQLLFEYFPRDVVYSTEEMVSELPPYNNKKSDQPFLPEYIKKYLQKK